nr:hypothetical protein [Tanacetum cinerariifolium]
ERALSISGDVYPKWCLKFFSPMYFDKGGDRTKLMTKKCIWFRLCGHEQMLTLPQFAVLLGLYEEDELKHHLFAIHFTKLEVDDKAGSKERCQKRELWMMSALEESRGINLAWVIAEHVCKHTPGLKENSLICGGYYVTKIAQLLGYLVDEEVAKYLEPIECEKGKHYGDAYYVGPIVTSSGYEIGGSLGGVHGNDDEDDMSDQYVHSENCMSSEDDDMQD